MAAPRPPKPLPTIATPVRIAASLGASAERPYYRPMCRNSRTLFNFEPPATDDEGRASSVQFVRKLSGFHHPSKTNQEAFDRAVEEVTAAARRLVDSLVTNTPPRDRVQVAALARERSARRFSRAR